MSLSGLISGSECATSSNALSQVLKHAEVDRSLQRDRLGGPPTSSLQRLPRTFPTPQDLDLQSARQFFGPMPTTQHTLPTFPVAAEWSLSTLHHQASPGLQDERDVMARERAFFPMKGSTWNADLERFKATADSPRQSHTPTAMGTPIYDSALQFRPPPPTNFLPMAQNFHIPAQYASPPLVTDSKGKGKAVDTEFEAAFLEAEQVRLHSDVRRSTPELDQIMDQLSLERQRLREEEPLKGSDFQRVWMDLNAPKPGHARIEDLAEWEKEFNSVMEAQREQLEQDYGFEINPDMANLDSDFGFGPASASKPYDSAGLPQLGQYEFEKDNPHLSDARSCLDAAKELLKSGGPLGEIATLLEAAIQKGDLGEGGFQAWILLGEVRGMDERDELGILALREGVRIAQEAGGGGGAGMLSLAITYTNEGYDRASQTMLLNWLKARYPQFASSVSIPDTYTQPWAIHNLLTDAFLSVARAHHSSTSDPDPELQVGLGVLFYINSEFAKAADCFSVALQVRPTDYLLWNRYGSCLSNGSKPEEALHAYREALRLRPMYTRAIYNVGVACLNIGAAKEAAEHFLTGLAMQGNERNDQKGGPGRSEQLWQTLRRALIAMDRADLADKAKEGNLDFFRNQGFDF